MLAFRGLPRPSRFATVLTFGIISAIVLAIVFFLMLNGSRRRLRQAQARNRFMQIGLRIHNFHDVLRRIPTSSYDINGQPLLSWRVYLLPYIEHQQLFRQFHLDEPWDSEHNLQLVEQMPDVYRDPHFDLPGRTMYLQPIGKGALFGKGEDDNGRELLEIRAHTNRDGTAYGWTKMLTYEDISDPAESTILMIEADPDRAVIWTKPDDFDFNPDEPLAGLGHTTPGGFHVRFVDGSVAFLPLDISQEKLRLLFDPDDGQLVELEKASP